MRVRLNLSFPKTHRALARWIVLVFVLSLLLGAAFVLAELHHDCTGENCQICAAVAHTVSFLKAEPVSLALPIMLAAWLSAALLAGAVPKQALTETPSLVTLKVKLSD